jgi:uncharacterized membrane protein YbhN (UPF0104 family)
VPARLRSPWLAQVLAAIALLALAAWQSDRDQILDSLRQVSAGWLLVALLIYIGARFLHSLESRIVLSRIGRPPVLGLYFVLLVGSLVNAVLPANLGDVAKVQIMANKYRLPRVAVVASRGAEAVVNGVMFVVFVILGLVLASGEGGSSGKLQFVLAGASSIVCGGMIAVAIAMPETLPAWGWLRRLPRAVQHILERYWPPIFEGFEAVRRPRLLLSLLALNVVGWCVEIAMYWAYGHAFNLDVPIGAYVSVAVVIALVTTFPVTFGNVGSWEVGIIAALRIYDVPHETALAFAVGIHVFVTVFNIGLGLIAMFALGLRPHDLLSLTSRRGEQQATTASVAS